MKVLVCGGRDFTDTEFVYKTLDGISKSFRTGIDVIIEGDAKGVDRMAGYWARKHKIDNWKFPADWDKHGRAAGPIRNQEMLDKTAPDLVVAISGGKGTKDMVSRALKAKVRVIEYSGLYTKVTHPDGKVDTYWP